jgi:hypothetical protein
MRIAAPALCALLLLLASCAGRTPDAGWTTLIDGDKGLENFDRVGDVNWRAEGGLIVGDKGKGGHLVSKNAYKDVEVYAEFWADHTTNSGVWVRASDPKSVTTTNAYEVNIFDQREGPEYSTGSIVGVAVVPVPNPHRAGGQWNTMEIRARGNDISVWMNGVFTAGTTRATIPSGHVTLQFGNGAKGAPGGAIKWRKLQVRAL